MTRVKPISNVRRDGTEQTFEYFSGMHRPLRLSCLAQARH